MLILNSAERLGLSPIADLNTSYVDIKRKKLI